MMFRIVIENNGTTLRYSAAVRHDTAQEAATGVAARTTQHAAGIESRYNFLYHD